MNKTAAVTTLCLLAFRILACSSSEALKQTPPQETETIKEFLSRYEKKFDPSLYDVGSALIVIEPLKLPESAAHQDTVQKQQELETTLGFRVQVLTTQDIVDANRLKDSLENLLPTDWIYVVYDVPTYKVRIGNYADKGSAVKMVRFLSDNGFPDAWVVPDQIIKNPAIRLPRVVMPVDTTGNH